jgi:hypothetical protein
MPEMKSLNFVELLKMLHSAFPAMSLPTFTEMIEFSGEKTMCANFVNELELYRFKDVNEELIRSSRLELFCLCPNALKWILPHYLEYCIASERRLSDEYVESLVYFFNPEPERFSDAQKRISSLTESQLECVVTLFRLKVEGDEWFQVMLDEFNGAINFVELEITKRRKVNQV